MRLLHRGKKELTDRPTDQPSPSRAIFRLVFLAQARRRVGRSSQAASLGAHAVGWTHGGLSSASPPRHRRFCVGVVTRVTAWDSPAHRSPIVDRREARRLSTATGDAPLSSGFRVGPAGACQARAHAQHVAARIGWYQITRPHAERERLAYVLPRLPLACERERRTAAPSS